MFVALFFVALIVVGGHSSFDVNDLDWSIRPTDNFFLFVNGRWLNKTSIPPSQTIVGGIFQTKHENNLKLKIILDDLLQDEDPDHPYPARSVKQQLADFYRAGLDTEAIEQVGLEPLRETLMELEQVSTYQELLVFVAKWYQEMNKDILFEFEVNPDSRNSSIYTIQWKQSGCELPSRSYYFRNDPFSKKIRRNYVYYIHQLLTLSNSLLNVTTDMEDAEDVLSLETQLAVSYRAPSQLRDVELNFNLYNRRELEDQMPHLNWNGLLSLLTIDCPTIIIEHPDYYLLLDKLLVTQSLQVWKNKVRFTILNKMAQYLSGDFSRTSFELFDQLINGQKQEKPRWLTIVEFIDKYIGETLGRLFVDRHFPSASKGLINVLVENILNAYHQRLSRLTWLQPQTKVQALKKLKSITAKIGYPSKWTSYEEIEIGGKSYFQSVRNIFHYGYMKKIRDLRSSVVDRQEWPVPPQVVNAFYSPSLNEMIFPAAILQNPFFSPENDDALNYGGIGSAIGHELTHGFDDQGRKYDEYGNLRLWWTPEDIQNFHLRAVKLVEQYSAHQILNERINGNLTLGENLADLGGLEISYQAFLKTKQAKEGVKIDGLTPNQRFFLAFARAWRVKMTDARMLVQIKQDPHSPEIVRINVPLSNMMGFYRAFNVTEGDAMFREAGDRLLIW